MNRFSFKFVGIFMFLGLLGLLFQDCTNSTFKIHNSDLSSLSETTVPVLVPTSDFAINVKPIIESKCVGCHSSGQIATRISFQTSNAIAVFGNAILRKLETKTMPPWFLKNDGTCGSYAHDPTVTASEFNAIKTWIETKTNNGSPIEGEKNIPLTVSPQIGLSTTDPDVLKIQMPANYIPEPNAGEVDEYRCFILNPNTTIDKAMTAYQVIPGRKEIVHHVLLYSLNSANAEAQVEQLDSQDNRPGYRCFGSIGPSNIDASPVIIWAPGQLVEKLPDDTGLFLPAGRKLVMQVHYNISSLPDTGDQTQILIKTTSPANVQSGNWLFVGSASGATIPSGQENVSRQFSAAAPFSGKMFGFFPHMHRYGKNLKLERGNDCLGFAESWDFNWQLNYFLKNPISVTQGENLNVTCNYDTRQATANVSFGEDSDQEMCFGFVYLVKSNSKSDTNPPTTTTNWNAVLLNDTTPGQIVTRISFAEADQGKTGALFVGAYYLNQWYFWDSTQSPDHRWINTDLTTSPSLPSALVGVAPAELDFIITELNLDWHGAQIFMGTGFGNSDRDRKNELLNSQRYKKVYDIR